MPLTAGTRLGPYEVTAILGAGGMGEVYRASDTKLKREVAIKVLPDVVAADAERLARFRREAEVLASLNHPNIAAIYGIEESAGIDALVMELVEGPTLADRIEQGPIPVAQALSIAKQIADALDAAHERGIVHRDLKPANIKVKDDGTVKVLDFGLAKAIDGAGGAGGSGGSDHAAGLSRSPTITTPAMTAAGMILGTAAYMSPEQARGRAVDRRADIWAFGCVLYEMVTGWQPFTGEDVGETVAAVIKSSPDLASVPRELRRLIEKCLEKDPRARLRDIADWALLVGGSPAAAPSRAGARRWLWPAVAALLFAAAAAGWFRPQPAIETAPVALSILPPQDMTLSPVGSLMSAPLISPDGSAVLFLATNGYYVRRLDSLDAVRVPGAERATNAGFWGPDSASVLYPVSGQGLYRVRLPDGAPELVIRRPDVVSRGGAMHPDGTTVLATFPPVMVDAPGGDPRPVDLSALGAPGDLLYPEFLPGGHDLLFFFRANDPHMSGMYVGALEHGALRDPVRLLDTATAACYTPAGGGMLLFVRDDNLYAQPVATDHRRIVGDSRLIETRVASGRGTGADKGDFSVSMAGAIAWRPGVAALAQTTAYDRRGAPLATSGPAIPASSLELSPEGDRLLASAGGDGDAWLIDVNQPAAQTLGPGSLLWLADGSRILGVDGENVWARPAAGGPTEDEGTAAGSPVALSPDGRHLLVHEGGRTLVQTLGSSATHAESSVFIDSSAFGESFSPDGRWVVYTDAGGGMFVQPFPGPGLRRQIASNVRVPRWRADGAEILATANPAPGDTGGGVLSIPVTWRGDEPRFGAPQRLFTNRLRRPPGATLSSKPLAVSRDGATFYWLQAVEQPGPDVIQVRTHAVQ